MTGATACLTSSMVLKPVFEVTKRAPGASDNKRQQSQLYAAPRVRYDLRYGCLSLSKPSTTVGAFSDSAEDRKGTNLHSQLHSPTPGYLLSTPAASSTTWSLPSSLCSMRNQKVIVFDASKRETHHPGNGFKKLSRRLKSGYKLQM